MNILYEIFNNGITSEIIDLITNWNSPYFNTKGLRFEFFRKNGVLLRGRHPEGENIYNDQHFKYAVSTKIGDILRRLHGLGYIEKVSNTAWKVIKKIDIPHNELYSVSEKNAKEKKSR